MASRLHNRHQESISHLLEQESLENLSGSLICLKISVRQAPEIFHRGALLFGVEGISSEAYSLSFDEEIEDQDSDSLRKLDEPHSLHIAPNLLSDWDEDSAESGGVPLPSSTGSDLVADDEPFPRITRHVYRCDCFSPGVGMVRSVMLK
jgi:hypothetical protein